MKNLLDYLEEKEVLKVESEKDIFLACQHNYDMFKLIRDTLQVDFENCLYIDRTHARFGDFYRKDEYNIMSVNELMERKNLEESKSDIWIELT